jgi:nicotinamide riboside kinase
MTLRVVLSGVESTGKSRLAAELAEHFGAPLVPEYGRAYCEALDRPFTPEDLRAIAAGHAAASAEAARGDPPMLIEDTDIVMTAAWSRMSFGVSDPALGARSDGLHLLLLPDVPFVADPVRMYGAEDARRAFHAHVVAEYESRRLSYVPIGGTWHARRSRALAAMELAFPGADR